MRDSEYENDVIETLFEEITIFGNRDFKELVGLARESFPLFNDTDIWEIVDDAVDRAILFYRDEAGGSHELKNIEWLYNSEDILKELPEV